MKHVSKLLIIVVPVFLVGYILEKAIDQSGLNNPGLVEHPLEIISELFSVFVAFSIFAITWHAYTKSKDNQSLLLGSSFAIVGLLILFHMLSYPFMPDFITPNSSHKSAIFLIGSRLFLAVSLIASAYTYKDTFPKLINKRVLLSSLIALFAASFAFIPFYHGYMFKDLDPAKGYSTSTILLVSMNTAIILYASYLYYKRIKETGQKNFIFLIYGSIIIVFSNIVYFSYEYAGHFLIIIGFYLIYLALYKSSVELPYEKLALAEEKLRRASEDKYRNLFNNANDAIITTDTEDRITSWNRSAEKIFGWGAREVIGRKLSPLIVPDELREKREQFVSDALIGTGITGIETAGLHKDGSRIDVSLTVSPMLDTDREITGLSVILRDIRERKKIEEEKDKLLKAIDNSNDGIIIADEKDQYIYLNEAYAKIYGYPKEELIGETWRKLIPQELITATELELDRTIRNKDVCILSGEFPAVRKDGVTIPLDVRATGLWDEKGGYQGHICIIRDITERKRTEEMLRKSMSILEKAQEIGQMGSWEWDIATNELTWSDEVYRLYGLDPARDRPNYDMVINTLAPECKDDFLKDIEDTLKNDSPFDREYCLFRPDGTSRYTHTRGEVTRDKEGNPVRMFGIVQDITDRKGAEEKLRLFRNLIDQSIDAIFVSDPKTGRILDANDRACVNLGYKREELLNMRVFDFEANLPDQFSYREHVKEVQNRGYVLFEGRHRRQNGTTFPVEVNVSSTVLGKISYLVAVVRDVTERKQAEEQIRQSLKEKEILLREIHHRVKNNLQIVSSLLAHQAEYIQDKNVIDMFTESQNRILSMSLVHEKLYQSKDLAKIDFNEYINDMVAELIQSYEFNAGKITLNMNIENIPLDIGFAIPCGLIINELVTNSLKYAFPAGTQGEIRITLRSTDENMLELMVSDNGIGIPEDLDFRKTESLGLHLITTLAENQLHGEISLDRSKGTEFQIKFRGIK